MIRISLGHNLSWFTKNTQIMLPRAQEEIATEDNIFLLSSLPLFCWHLKSKLFVLYPQQSFVLSVGFFFTPFFFTPFSLLGFWASLCMRDSTFSFFFSMFTVFRSFIDVFFIDQWLEAEFQLQTYTLFCYLAL